MNTPNPWRAVGTIGQSVWIDEWRRAWLHDGTLTGLIADDRVSGLTTNPTILEQAIASGAEYESAIAQREELEPEALAQELVIDDVRAAARRFQPVYESTAGRDGFVSVEVAPALAHDTAGTIAAAQALWAAIGRPNVMIKVPATTAGLPAIRRLVALGINVNATLLFGVERYAQVAGAFMAGCEDRHAAHLAPAGIASVASFFLSRIDSAVDRRLDAHPDRRAAAALRGSLAIASARAAWVRYRALLETPRWRALAAQGARSQRLLWASTSVKDPAYRDVKYIEALVAPDTVVTVPRDTLAAFRDHGHAAVGPGLGAAEVDPAAALRALGIDLTAVLRELEEEGLAKFTASHAALLKALARRQAAVEHS